MITITLSVQELQKRNACQESVDFFCSLCEKTAEKKIVIENWTPLHSLWLAKWRPRDFKWLRDHGLVPAILWRRANLTGADLRKAELRGADLSRANLRGADLAGAYLPEANLYGANLHRADLHRANLAEANLTGADLCEANLAGADLYGANLRGTNLAGADLTRSDLRGAYLTRADLAGADLAGADLAGAYRLTDDPAIPGWKVKNGILVREWLESNKWNSGERMIALRRCPCPCGSADASWHGPEEGVRVYCCDVCWRRLRAKRIYTERI